MAGSQGNVTANQSQGAAVEVTPNIIRPHSGGSRSTEGTGLESSGGGAMMVEVAVGQRGVKRDHTRMMSWVDESSPSVVEVADDVPVGIVSCPAEDGTAAQQDAPVAGESPIVDSAMGVDVESIALLVEGARDKVMGELGDGAGLSRSAGKSNTPEWEVVQGAMFPPATGDGGVVSSGGQELVSAHPVMVPGGDDDVESRGDTHQHTIRNMRCPGEASMDGNAVKVSMVDAFAGTGLIGHLFATKPVSRQTGLALVWDVAAVCEKAECPRQWLQHLHPGVLMGGDAESLEEGWRSWTRDMLPPLCVLVTGGTPCPPFSKAGPQRTHRDPRSRLLRDPVDMAVKFGMPWVMQENVAPLIDDDKLGLSHGCYSALLEYAAERGYHPIMAHTVRDADFGGFSCRDRAFILLEHKSVSESLGPPEPPPQPAPIITRSKVRQVLMPTEQVAHLLLPNQEMTLMPSIEWDSKWPVRLGTVTWQCDEVEPGAMVTLKQRVWSEGNYGCVKAWYVQKLDFSEKGFRVTDEYRKCVTTIPSHGGKRFVTKADVTSIVRRKAEVFAVDGIAHSMTAYYEYPRCGIMLIMDDRFEGAQVRPLHIRESWQVQSLPLQWCDELVGMGVSEAHIAALAGNCIAATSLVPHVQYTHDRISRYFEAMAVLPTKGVPWMHPGSVVQPKACRVILVPVMRSSVSRTWWCSRQVVISRSLVQPCK